MHAKYIYSNKLFPPEYCGMVIESPNSGNAHYFSGQSTIKMIEADKNIFCMYLLDDWELVVLFQIYSWHFHSIFVYIQYSAKLEYHYSTIDFTRLSSSIHVFCYSCTIDADKKQIDCLFFIHFASGLTPIHWLLSSFYLFCFNINLSSFSIWSSI